MLKIGYGSANLEPLTKWEVFFETRCRSLLNTAFVVHIAIYLNLCYMHIADLTYLFLHSVSYHVSVIMWYHMHEMLTVATDVP